MTDLEREFWGPRWTPRGIAALAIAGAVVVVLVVATVIVVRDIVVQGAARDPETSAEHWLRHLAEEEYDEACEMAVSISAKPKRPLRKGVPGFDGCTASVRASTKDLTPVQRRNLRDIEVTDVHRFGEVAFVTDDGLTPSLDLDPTARVVSMLRVDGRWYVTIATD